MKQINTYQIPNFPMGMYPGADDADYGAGKGVFNLKHEEDIG